LLLLLLRRRRSREVRQLSKRQLAHVLHLVPVL
jgi:hypothetical protein